MHEKLKLARHHGQQFLLDRGGAGLDLRDPQTVIRSLTHGRRRKRQRREWQRCPATNGQRLSDRRPHLRRRRGRRRRRGPARRGRLQRGRTAHRLHHQGVSDALAHGGGAGRHLRGARQHASGRLALAHVRHRQGVGLARRPGFDRIHGAPGAGGGLRTRALGRAVLAHRGRQDLSAAVRRHDGGLRQGPGAAHLRRRRPHRPRHAAHHVRPGAAALGGILHRVSSPST